MENVIIAVDAGGTKTKVVAIDNNKNIVYELVGGSGSPAVVGDKAIKNIFALVREVYENIKDKYNVCFVQMGLSGFGVLENVSLLEDELKDILGVDVSIDSDTNLGLYSIVEDKYNEGILIISGTGSAVVGMKDDNILLHGGYGVLLTETGSSYVAVKSLIVSIINQYEESMTYSKLGLEFLDLIGAKSVGDFRKFMYRKTKDEIANYSKFISRKALEGDVDAINILKKSARALASSVKRLHRNLKLTPNYVLGFVGGFIQKAPIVKEELLLILKEDNILPKLYKESDDPVFGAFYMAKRKGKI